MSFADENNMTIASPCVRNCCLNTDEICMGCFRHIDEILAWQGYKNNEKKSVISTCVKRRTAAQEKIAQGKS